MIGESVSSSTTRSRLNSNVMIAPAEAGMVIEGVNLVMDSDLNYNLAGGVEITIVATDDEGLTAEEAFILIITPVNDAPIVAAPIADIAIDEDPGMTVVADLDEVFTDVDDIQLAFEISVGFLLH